MHKSLLHEYWTVENAVWSSKLFNKLDREFGTAWLTERKDGVWQEPTRFRPPAAIERDRFGQSVAIDANGQTIAVGAPMRGAPLTDDRPAPLKFGEGIFHSGAVYIYTRPDPAE
ncbi:MAG: FG-GAP repeat protein [Gammaproteobacteria bacterium]|nr:FG-GAP repeat protein [Gammaproteobacteria bacterium]